MDKKDFVHFINEIDKGVLKWRTASNRAAEDSDSFYLYPTFGMFDVAIEMLETVMEDTGHYISYYIWDLDFGKEGKECIEIESGVKASLTSPEELYDFILTIDSK